MSRTILAQPPLDSGLKPIHGTGYSWLQERMLFVRDPLRVVTERRARFGDITFMNTLGRHKVVMPLTASGVEEIAMNREKAFASEPAWSFFIGPFFHRGLMLMDFEEHRYHRRIMQQAFAVGHLERYLAAMEPVVAEGVRRFPAGEGVHLLSEFKALTLDLALRTFLGLAVPAGEARRINRAFEDCLAAGLAIVRHNVPGTKWAKGLAGRKILEEFFFRRLAAKRAVETDDLFSVLCHAMSPEGEVFTDEDVVNHMIFVLMAAHDTSTIALTTMAYYLALHPEWQAKARAQSQAFGRELDYRRMGELAVLDAVMRESMRLNAPVPRLPREALIDTHIGDYFIPKGTFVSASTTVTHFDPTLWSDPEAFDPGRFAAERGEDKAHKFAWMPFGGGMHKCIGLHFGQLEVKAIMHHLLLRYEWSVPEDYKWKLDYTTLPVPKDKLPVRLRKLGLID
ncbi:cytochrome P450 [Antrihabitans cavernicola]|uniref:Cytochrome P450 n=1 Tax=Antrihabitans cavernicola TaxID=2495913 RepID=A0A5A7SG45_9NOCA|nr:cytochrome P450 [Spelaeibacter cavernicola]KAA0024162.1 cytochrome P450 [Spelaeibacter cavernicola]